jgi:hypothetical protein
MLFSNLCSVVAVKINNIYLTTGGLEEDLAEALAFWKRCISPLTNNRT